MKDVICRKNWHYNRRLFCMKCLSPTVKLLHLKKITHNEHRERKIRCDCNQVQIQRNNFVLIWVNEDKTEFSRLLTAIKNFRRDLYVCWIGTNIHSKWFAVGQIRHLRLKPRCANEILANSQTMKSWYDWWVSDIKTIVCKFDLAYMWNPSISWTSMKTKWTEEKERRRRRKHVWNVNNASICVSMSEDSIVYGPKNEGRTWNLPRNRHIFN